MGVAPCIDDPGAQNSESPFAGLDLQSLTVLAGLVTVAVSMWFFTVGVVRVAVLPANAFSYLEQLPLEYWVGLAATIVLLGIGGPLTKNHTNARILVELLALFMLSLYLLGLPSFVYQDPRFLDSFQHEGNALTLLGEGGWYNAPVWYLYQFPGAYTFFAELTAIAGISPFQAMKYFTVGLSLVISLMLYTIIRSFSRRYCALATAFVMSGLWFELHLAPQSLELIPYLGVLFVFIKSLEDFPRRKLWMSIAILCVPVLVITHPETSVTLILGLVEVLVLGLLFERNRGRSLRLNLSAIGPFLAILICFTLAWYLSIASSAFDTALGIFSSALAAGFHASAKVPMTPSVSYWVTTRLEEAVSAFVWILSLFLLLFVRKFQRRDYLFMGLCLSGITTIPVALSGNIDVLQRSYLFALLPLGLLLASLLENRESLRLVHFPSALITRILELSLLLGVIFFSILIPITRYGGDSFEYLPASSLLTSNVASSVANGYSLLTPNPAWYGVRYYTPFYGYDSDLHSVEPSNMSAITGVYIGGYLTNGAIEWNLTFTVPDSTANYLLMSDPLFINSYILNFGPNSSFYLRSYAQFENQTALNYNLVYSSGTDRLYENKVLG